MDWETKLNRAFTKNGPGLRFEYPNGCLSATQFCENPELLAVIMRQTDGTLIFRGTMSITGFAARIAEPSTTTDFMHADGAGASIRNKIDAMTAEPAGTMAGLPK